MRASSYASEGNQTKMRKKPKPSNLSLKAMLIDPSHGGNSTEGMKNGKPNCGTEKAVQFLMLVV